MDDKNFYKSFRFLNESFALNEIEEKEKISLPTAAFKEDANMFSSEFREGFVWSLVFDYGYIIKQLIRPIRQNIRILIFRTDLTSFCPYFKSVVRIFSCMDLTIGQ